MKRFDSRTAPTDTEVYFEPHFASATSLTMGDSAWPSSSQSRLLFDDSGKLIGRDFAAEPTAAESVVTVELPSAVVEATDSLATDKARIEAGTAAARIEAKLDQLLSMHDAQQAGAPEGI